MTTPQKIDLHMHSTASDGTDPPEALLSLVKAAGIDLFSLTDHDALKGGADIRALRTESDPVFVTGVEFSCRDEEGKYHILGYGYDPDSEPIRAVVEAGRRYRMQKVRARLDFLDSAFGFHFSKEELDALFRLDTPGKPHIADLMVRHGYARSIKEAIKEYIDQLGFANEYVRPEEAIAGILGSGGIPVLAHPCYGSGGELILGEELAQRLNRLMDFGLRGMEVYYSGFTAKLRLQMLALAEERGLYITAGSDYHGTNKLVQLGDTGLGSPAEWPDGLRRFLEDLRKSGQR